MCLQVPFKVLQDKIRIPCFLQKARRACRALLAASGWAKGRSKRLLKAAKHSKCSPSQAPKAQLSPQETLLGALGPPTPAAPGPLQCGWGRCVADEEPEAPSFQREGSDPGSPLDSPQEQCW